MLEIKNLSVGKILTDINLTVPDGARMLLKGSNGAGKTTLANAIIGDPSLKASGEIIFNGADITSLTTAARMRLGLFAGMQNVPELPGVSVMAFFKHSYAAYYGDAKMGEIMTKLKVAQARLNIPDSWLGRGMNVGFSGGEKKGLMFLHLMMTAPKLAILDEPDSGADAAARKLFGEIINEMRGTTFLIISHQEGWFAPTITATIEKGAIK